MRNSSLVKWFRADNVAGLKHTAEAVAFTYSIREPACLVCAVVWMGRGASCYQRSGGVTQPWRLHE